jgi:RHS repeat-associated protein
MWDAYGYNAEDYDAGTGMSYLRARYLNIAMGGFITEDTYKGNIFNPASLNLRGYVEGNPVTYTDPSGHASRRNYVEIEYSSGDSFYTVRTGNVVEFVLLPQYSAPKSSIPAPTPTLKPTQTPTLPPKPTPMPTDSPPKSPIIAVNQAGPTIGLSAEERAIIVEAARARLGMKYNSMKCSRLSKQAYAAIGIDLGRENAAYQAQLAKKLNWEISADDLKEGDLIFWYMPDCSCGREAEVHHVGVYVGNGKVVESSTSRDAVVERNIWEGAGFAIYSYVSPQK